VKAVEFFSGIGAFAEAARLFGIEVIAAFDQSKIANVVYQHNFGLRPWNRNLDTLPDWSIPDADMWWMSPPCTPFSVRGKRRDVEDPRARSLLHLIELAGILRPCLIAIENVMGFSGSEAEQLLWKSLSSKGYESRAWDLCSLDFGTPMRRRRRFVIFLRQPLSFRSTANLFTPFRSSADLIPPMRPLSEFLFDDSDYLYLDQDVLQRYGEGFDIIDPTNPAATLICFTKNYASCMRASGSLVQTPRGIRRVSPEEILGLLGFRSAYSIPESVEREWQWRLVGNSVDVRAITYLLQQIDTGLCQDMGVSGSERLQ
jgi:DNA (cytosine-5)-methyltransferase 1